MNDWRSKHAFKNTYIDFKPAVNTLKKSLWSRRWYAPYKKFYVKISKISVVFMLYKNFYVFLCFKFMKFYVIFSLLAIKNTLCASLNMFILAVTYNFLKIMIQNKSHINSKWICLWLYRFSNIYCQFYSQASRNVREHGIHPTQWTLSFKSS